MYECEDEDKELLSRLIDIICGDKMVGIEAAAIAMKRDAANYHALKADMAELWDMVCPKCAFTSADLKAGKSGTPRTDRVILETSPENERDEMRKHARQLERGVNSVLGWYETSHANYLHAIKTIERLEEESRLLMQLVRAHRGWQDETDHSLIELAKKLDEYSPEGCRGYEQRIDSDLCKHCGGMQSEHDAS